MTFLERRKLLQILHDCLSQPARVLVNKKVVALDARDGAVTTVLVQDGSAYTGELVVGADGVHSRVREEMWRLAEEQNPGFITTRERNSK